MNNLKLRTDLPSENENLDQRIRFDIQRERGALDTTKKLDTTDYFLSKSNLSQVNKQQSTLKLHESSFSVGPISSALSIVDEIESQSDEQASSLGDSSPQRHDEQSEHQRLNVSIDNDKKKSQICE